MRGTVVCMSVQNHNPGEGGTLKILYLSKYIGEDGHARYAAMYPEGYHGISLAFLGNNFKERIRFIHWRDFSGFQVIQGAVGLVHNQRNCYGSGR